MKLLHSARWLLLALLLSVIPASSYAGVFISVAFAPPVLPVYEQPPCPEPGWMWSPGYWAYHVGYYGGVNYGFGYMGIGFVGGMWRGHDFVYNTAIMRVDQGRIHNTYIDRNIVERNTIVNDRHVSFSGGRDGIHHDPMPEERLAERDQHVAVSSYQAQHESAARSDRNSYFKNNNGRPSSLAVARPMAPQSRTAPGSMKQTQQGTFNNRPATNAPSGVQSQPMRQTGPSNQNRQVQQAPQAQPNRQVQQAPQARQSQQPAAQPSRQVQQAPQARQPQQPQAQPSRQANQSKPSAQSKPKSSEKSNQEDRGHEKEK